MHGIWLSCESPPGAIHVFNLSWRLDVNFPKIQKYRMAYLNTSTMRALKNWIAIEIERADKYSSDKRQLIKSILQANLYGGIEFCAILVKKIYVVYHDPLLLDYRSEKPTDHFSRLKRALEGSLRPGQTVELIGLPVLLKGGAVIKINDPIVKKWADSLDEMVKRLAHPDEWFDLHEGFSAHWLKKIDRLID